MFCARYAETYCDLRQRSCHLAVVSKVRFFAESRRELKRPVLMDTEPTCNRTRLSGNADCVQSAAGDPGGITSETARLWSPVLIFGRADVSKVVLHYRPS